MGKTYPSLFAACLAIASVTIGVSSPAFAEERYSVTADGQEVIDNTARLAWRRCVEGRAWNGQKCAGNPLLFKFRTAKAHVAAQELSKGWRIPTRDELSALVVKNKRKPMIDQSLFPQTPASQTWASRPGFDDDLNAWLVHFGNGRVYGNTGARKFPLRLVRPLS